MRVAYSNPFVSYLISPPNTVQTKQLHWIIIFMTIYQIHGSRSVPNLNHSLISLSNSYLRTTKHWASHWTKKPLNSQLWPTQDVRAASLEFRLSVNLDKIRPHSSDDEDACRIQWGYYNPRSNYPSHIWTGQPWRASRDQANDIRDRQL